MKEITLRIPDQKLDFFLELIKQLGFEIDQEYSIPEEQRNLVRERLATMPESDFISWKEAKKRINYGKGRSGES